jgi:hypothetical protein
MWTLAKCMGYSDRGLAKICQRNNVPRPPRGYWRKKEQGYPTQKATLPKRRIVKLLDSEYRFDKTLMLEHENVQKKVNQNSPDTVECTTSLEDAHPLVIKTMQAWKRHGNDDEATVIKDYLDISVTDFHINRALLIMDSLIKSLEKQGHSVLIEDGQTKTVIAGVSVRFSLSEIYDPIYVSPPDSSWRGESYKSKHNGYNYEYHPSGQLKIKMHKGSWRWSHELRQNWKDTATKSLEGQLSNVIKGFVIGAIAHRNALREERERERRRLEKEELEMQRAILIQKEKEQIATLKKLSDLWNSSNKVRAFVAKVEQEVQKGNTPTFVPGDAAQWIQWAKSYADFLDPLTDNYEFTFDYL